MLGSVLAGARSSRVVEKKWVFGALAAALAQTAVVAGAVAAVASRR